MADLKKKTTQDLKKMLVEKREDERKFRFDISGTKKTNVREGSNARKEIARIKTELRIREIEGNK
jgi:ribosomal protein L29